MNGSIATRTIPDLSPHSPVKSLGLHILPGTLTTVAFLVFKPLLDSSGYPSLTLVFVGAFVVVYVLMMAVTPLTNLMRESVFSWLPDWMFLEEQTQYQAYAKSALLVTLALQLVLTGVVLP